MALDPTVGRCQERSGFLFKHDCEGEGIARCDECGKAVCVDHRHDLNGRDLCTTCLRQQPAATVQSFERNPYFYQRTWYRHGHFSFNSPDDPDDFTEADGTSTMTHGDQAFENDLGAS